MNFRYREVIKSDTAKRLNINNEVPKNLMDNLMVSTYGIQSIRELIRVPMRVTSWYRSLKLNRAIGSKDTSHHRQCLAVDFIPVRMDIREAFILIAESDMMFDQLLLETNSRGSRWLHISFHRDNRRQVIEIQA